MRACSTLLVAGSAWRIAAASSSAAAALWTSIEDRKLLTNGRPDAAETLPEVVIGRVEAREDQPGDGEIEGARGEPMVRPVEEYRACRAQHDVARVEIAVNEAVTRRCAGWTHPVQAGMELGQQRPVPTCLGGTFDEGREHGGPCHPIHADVRAGCRTHAGDRNAGGSR